MREAELEAFLPARKNKNGHRPAVAHTFLAPDGTAAFLVADSHVPAVQKRIDAKTRNTRGERSVKAMDGKTYVLFFGTESILSNWHEANGPFYSSQFEMLFLSSEVGMMMVKAATFGDKESMDKLRKSKTSKAAKALGRKVTPFNESDWNAKGPDALFIVLMDKFAPHNKANYDHLMATQDAILVEASPYDKIWGSGLSLDDDRNADPAKWKGKNKLGILLMKVRAARQEGV